MSIYGQVGHKERVDWTITTQIITLCTLISSLLLFLQWYLYCVSLFDWREWVKVLADLPLLLKFVCVLVGLVDIWLCNKWENGVRHAAQRISEVSYKTFYKCARQYKNIFQAHFSALRARFAVFFALVRMGDRGDSEDNSYFSASGARYNQLN